jgi:hypothetical protein
MRARTTSLLLLAALACAGCERDARKGQPGRRVAGERVMLEVTFALNGDQDVLDIAAACEPWSGADELRGPATPAAFEPLAAELARMSSLDDSENQGYVVDCSELQTGRRSSLEQKRLPQAQATGGLRPPAGVEDP